MRRILVCLIVTLLPTFVLGQEEKPLYQEGKHGRGELKYLDGVPILTVAGSPEEIGEQIAVLTGKDAKKLFNYPKDVMKDFSAGFAWPVVLAAGRNMLPQFPEAQRRELDAMVKHGLERDNLVAANTMFDIVKLIACSTVQVEKERSKTGTMLFGRNLDFPTAGYLQKYSLVIVYKPEGKHAFASIAFPGLLGCLSGINDAGLALSVLEVLDARDGSAKFNSKGTPYAMNYRRVLEECTTIEEAEKLLKTMKRTTRNNLAICDKNGSAVIEITPKSVVVRRSHEGCCLCTNHFQTKELAPEVIENRVSTTDRLTILEEVSKKNEKLDVNDVWHALHRVNGGAFTLQTMIFEPEEYRLYLSIGTAPASAKQPSMLELSGLLGVAKADAKAAGQGK